MKYILFISAVVIVFFAACTSGDISSLSKSECIKQGFKYKMEKRFNYRHGEYEIKTICSKRV